jgi:hypothetical protein
VRIQAQGVTRQARQTPVFALIDAGEIICRGIRTLCIADDLQK